MRSLSLTALLVGGAHVWLRAAGSPPVKVALRTSWPAASLLLEIIESAALERPEDYFNILDLLTSNEALATSTQLSDQAIYSSSLELLASHGLLDAPGTRESLELALALHATTPKIEAFYQFFADAHATMVAQPDCESFVDWYGEHICDAASLRRRIDVDTLDSTQNIEPKDGPIYNRPPLLSIDHVYPPPARTLTAPNRTAILYASLTSSNFRQLHETLYKQAQPSAGEHRIQYVARYIPPATGRDAGSYSYLSGYGVGLDLKKMDYLAMDDRRTGSSGQSDEEATEAQRKASGSEQDIEALETLAALLESVPEDQKTAQLSKEEVAVIGLVASQLVLNATSPLTMLRHISQDFPLYALPLARGGAQYPEELANEIRANQQRVGGGISMLWLNGMMVQDLDAFSLLNHMRRERAIMGSLTSAGLSSAQAFDLITHSAVAAAQNGGGDVTDGIFDASDRAEGGKAVIWLNDIATGAKYATWSSKISSLARQMFPGQFPRVKYNLWNVVLFVDLSRTDSTQLVAGSIGNIIHRGFPFRFGIVPSVETEDAAKAARLFAYMLESYGPDQTNEYFVTVMQQTVNGGVQERLNWDLARQQFNIQSGIAQPLEEDFEKKDFDMVVSPPPSEDGSEVVSEPRLAAARAFAKRLSLPVPSGQPGYAFVNGKFFDLDDDFFRSLQSEVGSMTEYMTGKIRADEVNDDTDFDNYWYDLPTSSKSRNQYIFPSAKTGPLKIVNLPEVFERTGFSKSFAGFAAESGDAPLATVWIVADLDSPDGIAFFKEALNALQKEASPAFRCTVTEGDDKVPKASHMLLLEATAGGVPPFEVLALLDILESRDYAHERVSALLRILDMAGRVTFNRHHDACRLLARDLGFKEGEHGILVNGRVIGPIEAGGFVAEDIVNLVSYEINKRIKPVVEALTAVSPDLTEDTSKLSDNVVTISSVLGALQIPDPTSAGLFQQQPQPRSKIYRDFLQGEHSSFKIGDSTKAIFNFAMIVDPISETAQKRVDLLEWLASTPYAHVEVYMNPVVTQPENEGLPLKRFYRTSLRPRLEFGDEGNQVAAFLKFDNLPVDPILTLSMDVHQSWLVRPHESQHDLDNIHLASLSARDAARGVEALFRLDYLVVEGHARESNTNTPPRGLQLQLTTIGNNSQPIADTLVVANLGYLQFKAKPGVYSMEIREGRGRDIFALDSAGNEGWNSASAEEAGANVALASFDGITLYPRFSRLPGKETADVLNASDDEEEKEGEGGIVDKVSQFFASWGSKTEESKDIVVAEPSTQADINIFTVASGHLYERFASIMILSVLRHTNSTVKFWFIENFLSPSFLEFIPHMAKEYNFQYELVTYKWPSWLRAQKEKQRIIWGYKILFLDVLFPMDLKKVIFVDADQIVRTDLKELVDLDLEGAPYGYTPMGDDNEAMEGFRFWKTGYWRDFLRGKPYHISALFVIDLARFRQLAAGDRLRQQYQGLSADPNSLANLDQDLPNNMQFDIPIFSLDKNWLWCETWCSMDRLDSAKTIDLCQNPLTKEPKLQRARQIPEWSLYDSEIAKFARSLADRGLIHSDAAAGDIDALASVGKTTAAAGEADVVPTEEETDSTASETPGATETPVEHRKDEL
ncbi:UDP-glucose:glycoprotein glucosyltransferase-domain-containing protein [Auriculariales sp. MPI-PUGE-AT-0066]|nr:UDP-glucose:glycoprotein glucosyltransferase-domain-containing protein [Auriculariales sp. MPI-PUGE-AT-0066]